MVRTRSGQGSHSGGQSLRGRPRSVNQGPSAGNAGNDNPPPVTLEAIQNLLHDAQMQNLAEIHNVINERLNDFSRTLSGTHARSATPESVIRSHSPTPSRPPPPNPPVPRGCTFKEFMTCRVK